MKESLNISLVQSSLFWEDKASNLDMFSQKIASVENSDVIILPEMFTTGFSMNPSKLAETMRGNTINWMKDQAKSKQAAICGSIIIQENEKYYNRFIWANPDGTLLHYDKRHLFSMAGEHEHYEAGETKLIINYLGWKICPLVCYDLRFPVWSRNKEDYDIAIYVANWPQKRSYHWKSLLLARAIENQCFVLGVNRVGTDGKDFYYSGDSSIIAADGEIIWQQADNETIYSYTLEKTTLQAIREKLPFLADRD